MAVATPMESGANCRLEELSLPDYVSLINGLVQLIGSDFRNLHSLDLNLNHPDIDSTKMVRLIGNLTKLEHVRFVGPGFTFDSSVLAAIVDSLPILKTLHIEFDISPEANLKNLSQLSELKRLHLQGDRMEYGGMAVAWSESFGPNLVSLSLATSSYGGPRYDGFLRELMVLISKASKLRRLILEIPKLNDDHLRHIASSCPKLREFSLGVNDFHTVKGLQFLVDQCPSLKYLDCVGAREVNVGKYRKIRFNSKEKGLFGREEWKE